MSSPIAKISHSNAEKKLIGLHQKASHKRRVAILADAIAARISDDRKGLCLDIGCGGMEITNQLQARFPSLQMVGLDLYPEARAVDIGVQWENYRQFNGVELPFNNKEAEVAIFSDVLHHMPSDVAKKMLSEANRVAKTVIIKDHFEYGRVSRTMLRAMDFVGNWAYGVSVPKKYFTPTEFRQVVAEVGLEIKSLNAGINLYDHLPLLRHVLRPTWQFISVLSSKAVV